MGCAFSQPQAVEWEAQDIGKQECWTNKGEIPLTHPGQIPAVLEPGSPKLTRAVHGSPGGPDGVELQGAISVNPIDESGVQIREQINWACGDCIGQGAFGKVMLGLNIVTGELMAVKQIRLCNEQAVAVPVAEHVKKVEVEVHLLKQLHHSNIVRYLGTEKTDVHLNIFLEYVPGGSIASLLSKFGRFNESVIKIYTRQILIGLEYLHGNNIMHRDIKGANILVDNTGLVKLADFGASRKIENLATIDSGVKQSIKGTPHWMAPEVIHQNNVGRQADIWSVACTVIEMATGKPPWSHITSPVSVMLLVAQSNSGPPLPESLSTACRDFLGLCFIRNPKDRANATRLLQHPFLKGVTCPSINTSPVANISTVATNLPKGLSQMEPVVVPSPTLEDSGTPTSRGTTTTTSSSNRRQEITEDMSRFSPMGAAVRHSQLAPVQEASFEAVSSSNPDDPASVGASNTFLRPPRLTTPNQPAFRYLAENPMLEPTWDVHHSPLRTGSQHQGVRKKAGWPHMPPSSPMKTEAKNDAARMSQSFKSFSLRPQSAVWPEQADTMQEQDDEAISGNAECQKVAQWQAELERELERERRDHNRSNSGRLLEPASRY